MGHVDQRDVKAEVMALTSSLERHWGQKQLSFCIESAISCAHGNYNLDPIAESEHFTRWHDMFIQECLDESNNYRTYNVNSKKRKRSSDDSGFPMKHFKLTHKKHARVRRVRKSVQRPYGVAPTKGLECPVRDDLASFVRLDPEPGTEKNDTPKPKRKKCAFCGRGKTLYKCKGCQLRFCMKPPVHLTIPNSDPPRCFPSNGPWCWHRSHGHNKWTNMQK